MRTYIFAIATAALFAIPTAAFSEDIHIGPGGVRIGPSYGHHRYYNRDEGGAAQNCGRLAFIKNS